MNVKFYNKSYPVKTDDCHEKQHNDKSCVCDKLKEVCLGTNIRIYYAGGQIDLTFESIHRGCIKGQTVDNTPTYIGCRKVVGFSIICECPPGWLRPGETYYYIGVLPNRVIDSVLVEWEDGGNNAQGTLYIDKVFFGTADIPDNPGIHQFTGLNYPTTETTVVSILISGGCANVIRLTVTYVTN